MSSVLQFPRLTRVKPLQAPAAYDIHNNGHCRIQGCMSDAIRQSWLRKAATWMAVFVCLLVAPVGSGILSLCMGKGHVAVELPHGGYSRLAAGAERADVKAFHAAGSPCVDIPLLQAANPEKSPVANSLGGGKDFTVGIFSGSLGAPPQCGQIVRPSSQIEINPVLLHRRTVVLLI